MYAVTRVRRRAPSCDIKGGIWGRVENPCNIKAFVLERWRPDVVIAADDNAASPIVLWGNAAYTLHRVGGQDPVPVDQRTGGGAYQLLGTFDLDLTSRVMLSDDADGKVIADAIRLVSVTPTLELNHIHADHLGTPKVLTNSARGIVRQAAYAPFGRADVTTEPVSKLGVSWRHTFTRR